MNGVVTGGWEFVWAAYALTGVSFLLYGVMIITRVREDYRRMKAEGGTR